MYSLIFLQKQILNVLVTQRVFEIVFNEKTFWLATKSTWSNFIDVLELPLFQRLF